MKGSHFNSYFQVAETVREMFPNANKTNFYRTGSTIPQKISGSTSKTKFSIFGFKQL